MAVNLPPLGELLPVPGVRLGMACAGIKQRRRDDLAIIELAEGSTVAGVFTQNRFRAPPVALAEARIQSGNPRLLLINSGNANAATGQRGFEDAEGALPPGRGVLRKRHCRRAGAALLHGRDWGKTPGGRHERGHRHRGPLRRGWAAAAAAIMTTDTAPKAVSERIQVAGAPVTITGIAKGAGMIKRTWPPCWPSSAAMRKCGNPPWRS